MSRSAYSQRGCPICGRSVSSNGAAWVSHMRGHVREGVVVEYRTGRGRFDFDPVRSIAEVPKDARSLMAASLPRDPYHERIRRAAETLYFRQDACWEYVTQWANGDTLWRDPATEATCIVEAITGIIRG